MLTALVLVILLTLALAFITGFHDVSNSIAAAVRTRALSPSVAVILAAIFNGLGCIGGAVIAYDLATWIALPEGANGLGVLIAALVTAAGWSLLTWWWRMPASTTHALICGLIGAGVASLWLGHQPVRGADPLLWLWLPLALGPPLAFGLCWVLVACFGRIDAHSEVQDLTQRNKVVLAAGSAAVALGHGLQVSTRLLSIMVLAVISSNALTPSAGVQALLVALIVLALCAGTLTGGWRVTYTLAYRLAFIDPLRGLLAQWTSAAMMFGAVALGPFPVSSSHAVASGIIGAATNGRAGSVNCRLALRMIGVWVLTLPVCLALGALLLLAMSPLLDTIG